MAEMTPEERVESAEERISTNNARTLTAIAIIGFVALVTILVIVWYMWIIVRQRQGESYSLLSVVIFLAECVMLGFALTFGRKRLIKLNERQDAMRDSLKEELIPLVTKEVKNCVETTRKKLEHKMASVEELRKELDETLAAGLAEFEKYAWLKDYKEVVDRLLIEPAISAAYELMDDLASQEPIPYNVILNLFDYIIASKDIVGSATDYHNLGVVFSRCDLLNEAAAIYQKGLEKFPDDIDLFSDIVQVCTTSDLGIDVSSFIKRIKDIPQKYWNWRCFTSLINYYNGQPHSAENKESSLALVEEYKKSLPHEERAYMAESETYDRYGEHEKAKDAFREGVAKCAIAARCATTLADRLLGEGFFDEAIKYATKAIDTAQPQLSVRLCSPYASRGFARDALVHLAIAEETDPRDLELDILAAIHDLEFAEKFGYGKREHIECRIGILKSLLPAR